MDEMQSMSSIDLNDEVKFSVSELLKLINTLPAGIGIYNVYFDGTIEAVFVNDSYYSIAGVNRKDREKFSGREAINAVVTADIPRLKAVLTDAIKDKSSFNIDIRIIAEGNTFKWFCLQGTPMHIMDDKIVYYCVFTDIDDLKKTQISILEEKERQEEQNIFFNSVLNNIPGAIVSFEVDEAGSHMKYLSEGVESLTGYTHDETLAYCQNDVLYFTYYEDRERIKEAAAKCAKTQERFSEEFRIITKDYTVKWVSLNLTPVIIGNKLTYYGIYLDISKEREATVLENTLVNSLPGGIVVYKISNDKIETSYFSDGILRLNGYTKEEYSELVKDNPVTVVYEEDRSKVSQRVDEAIKTGKKLEIVYRIKHKDGSLVWVQLSTTQISDVSGVKTYYAIYTQPTQEGQIYQNIVDSATTAVFIAEHGTRRLIFANKAWKRLRFIDENIDVAGLRLQNVIPFNDMIYSDEELENLPSDYFYESSTISTHGQYLHTFGKTINWGGHNAYVSYIVDETELWKSRQNLQEIIDKIPSGISIYEVQNDKTKLLFMNEMCKRIHNEILGEFSGRLLSMVYEQDKYIVENAIRSLYAGEDGFDIHFRIPDINGGLHWIRAVGVVVDRIGDKLTVYCSYSDFNDIMEIQQELESNRKMLRLAMDSAKVLVWRYNCKTHTITNTSSLGERFNLPIVVENLPDSIIEDGYISEESIDDFRRLYKDAEKGKPVECDIKSCSRENSAPAWHHQILTPVFDKYGNYVETIGTSIDVTEQKDRERNYEEQLRIKRLMSNDAIAMLHYNLSKNTVNDAQSNRDDLIEIMNCGSANQVLSKIRSYTNGEDESGKFDEVKDCASIIKTFDQGKEHISIRHHLGTEDHRWYESDFDVLPNPYTKDIEAVSTLRDITELVRAEEIVDTIIKIDYDSITTINASTGKYHFFSRGNYDELVDDSQSYLKDSAEVIDYLRTHCVSDNSEKIVDNLTTESIKRRLEYNSVVTEVIALNKHNGLEYKRLIYSYLDENKDTILCAIQDLTEEYMKEEKQKEELTSALQIAKQANQAKTEFFSRMSHDMRTPMNGILGLADLSVDEENVEALRDNMSKIKDAGTYLLRLINDTLDFQRIESGRMQLNYEVVSVQSLFENVLNIIKPDAENKHINFVFKTSEINEDRYVRIDPVRIEQIFINILSNAVKFTPEGGSITFSATMLSKTSEKYFAELSVTDTGVGMSKDFLENKLFQPFTQEHNDMSDKYAGTGLGLPIVKSLVGLMGGKIHVQSELGKGSSFIIELEIEKVKMDKAQEEISRSVQEQNNLINSLDGKKILLVEDNSLNATIATKLLAKAGCVTTWMDNGKKGVDAFASSKPHDFDVILMDIRMPVMTGLEAAKAIRTLDRPDAKKIPILAMTANAYEEDVKQTMEAGMNCHLSKPIDPKKMYAAIAKYCAEAER